MKFVEDYDDDRRQACCSGVAMSQRLGEGKAGWGSAISFPSLPLLFLSPLSGTICYSTSPLQNLCPSFAVALRLISLSAAFRDTLTVVVPER